MIFIGGRQRSGACACLLPDRAMRVSQSAPPMEQHSHSYDERGRRQLNSVVRANVFLAVVLVVSTPTLDTQAQKGAHEHRRRRWVEGPGRPAVWRLLIRRGHPCARCGAHGRRLGPLEGPAEPSRLVWRSSRVARLERALAGSVCGLVHLRTARVRRGLPIGHALRERDARPEHPLLRRAS